MSYILDALRRADAERERGAVPSLQSQQHTVIEEDETVPRSRRLLWLSVGLGAAVLALIAWNIFGGTTPPRPMAEGSVLPAAPAGVAPAPKAVPQVATDAAPATAPIAAPAIAAAVPPQRAASPVAARQTAAVPADARRAARRPAPESDPALAAVPPPASAALAETRIYAQAELPEDIRRELPKVAINGSSYSGDAASRMVMINGQVFHEGDKLGPGLVLEKINRRSAVFAYKGWRYEVSF